MQGERRRGLGACGLVRILFVVGILFVRSKSNERSWFVSPGFIQGCDIDRPVRLNLLVRSISHAIIFFSHNKIALIRKKKTIGQVARKSYELRRTKEPNAWSSLLWKGYARLMAITVISFILTHKAVLHANGGVCYQDLAYMNLFLFLQLYDKTSKCTTRECQFGFMEAIQFVEYTHLDWVNTICTCHM
jgi:phage tail protein X